ncbi:MAG: hypothetical protein QXH95_03370 [Thermoplasmata archaeon]
MFTGLNLNLREYGKKRIYRKIWKFPYNIKKFHQGFYRYPFEIWSFDEVPATAVNLREDIPTVQRDWWGNIVSTIVSSVQQFFEIQKLKEQAKIEALKTQTDGGFNWIKYGLIGIGAGILGYYFLIRKRR